MCHSTSYSVIFQFSHWPKNRQIWDILLVKIFLSKFYIWTTVCQPNYTELFIVDRVDSISIVNHFCFCSRIGICSFVSFFFIKIIYFPYIHQVRCLPYIKRTYIYRPQCKDFCWRNQQNIPWINNVHTNWFVTHDYYLFCFGQRQINNWIRIDKKTKNIKIEAINLSGCVCVCALYMLQLILINSL